MSNAPQAQHDQPTGDTDATDPAHIALDAMLARPRLSELTVAPDASVAVVAVSTQAPKGTRMRTALWALDPAGVEEPRQLTRSAAGESAAAFLPDGDLLFTSARPDPDAQDTPQDPPAALWRLPRAGGEPQLLVAPDAGVRGVWVAAEAPVVLFAAELHPGTGDLEQDAARAKARRDAGVTAQLHDPGTYPVAHWDRWLGPREPGLWVLDLRREVAEQDRVRLLARGPALRDASLALTPDGATVVTTWARTAARRSPDDLVSDLVAIEVATGERRVLAADGRAFGDPAVDPQGRRVVCTAQDLGAPDRVTDRTLVLVELSPGHTGDTGAPSDDAPRDLTPELDRWPDAPRWTPDGTAVLFLTDDQGHRSVNRVEVDAGTTPEGVPVQPVTRLTEDGAYSQVCLPAAGGAYALRAEVGAAPHPVRFDPAEPAADEVALPAPTGDDPDHTAVHRITTTTPDGDQVGSWLVLPNKASATAPVPLVVLIHGGPLSSWNGWHWRWNPHVFAAAGYAVLLPDPALSTGYGQEWIERGWGRWGAAPYTDVMAAVEDAAARDDIDGGRVAAAGGSFGGYLANWIAGHTDRFRGIVTHASLWSLRAFHGTTDLGLFWEREFGDPYLDDRRYRDNSPDAHVAQITTPMLVIHGEQDLRVPISEGVTLWTDLIRHGVDARLLYFPDEHHWILAPQHARLWYQTVLAFLREHLEDRPFQRPQLL